MSTPTYPDLRHVLWLGGSPCSGKSSISHLLVSQFNLTPYHVDDALSNHLSRLDSTQHTALTRWLSLSWDERWMQPMEQLIQDAIACYTEHFTFVLEDVVKLPVTQPVLVEGTALLPGLIAQLIPHPSPHQALWLIAEPNFQRAQYANRTWIRSILANCTEPETAFNNWMERDIQFAELIKNEAISIGFETLIVDGHTTLEENAHQVAAHFRLV